MERYAIIIKTDGVCVLLHCYPGDCLSRKDAAADVPLADDDLRVHGQS